jgi:hypothetical protein
LPRLTGRSSQLGFHREHPHTFHGALKHHNKLQSFTKACRSCGFHRCLPKLGQTPVTPRNLELGFIAIVAHRVPMQIFPSPTASFAHNGAAAEYFCFTVQAVRPGCCTQLKRTSETTQSGSSALTRPPHVQSHIRQLYAALPWVSVVAAHLQRDFSLPCTPSRVPNIQFNG